MDAAQPGTRVKLDWDGEDTDGDDVPVGTYHVSIEARDTNDNDLPIETWTSGMVSGIDNSEDGLPLVQIKDGPKIRFDEIKSIKG